MENDKHPTEIIQELDYEIDRVIDKIMNLNTILKESQDKLDKLQQRKQSLLNYLNTDNDE